VPTTSDVQIRDGRALTKSGSVSVYDLLKHLPAGLMIDVGAASGGTTRKMLAASPLSRVVSYEPFPGNIPFLHESCGKDDRVTIRNAAVGSMSGTASFSIAQTVDQSVKGWEDRVGYSSGGYLRRDDGDLRRQEITVEVVKLDEDIQETPIFIKIDVQGGELDVLRGASGLIGTGTPLIFCEYSGQKGILDFMVQHGYAIFDTEYLVVPRTDTDTLEEWEPVKRINLSSGKEALVCWPKNRPSDLDSFQAFLAGQRPKRIAAQTDLICVHERSLQEVMSIARSLG